MDGTARLSVDPDIMGYILHCMYSSLLNVSKVCVMYLNDTFLPLAVRHPCMCTIFHLQGLKVTVLWRKNDDTVMLSSTSRPATSDLHIALNRYYLLYNSVKRNLIHTSCRLPTRFENSLHVSELGRLRSIYKRVYFQGNPRLLIVTTPIELS